MMVVVLVMVLVSSILAVVGGVLWALLWYYKGLPLLAIVPPSFVTGFLFAALLFRYTPFGESPASSSRRCSSATRRSVSLYVRQCPTDVVNC